MAFDPNTLLTTIGSSFNVSQISPGINEQISIVAKDAALQAAALQAQGTLATTENQARLVDLNAQFNQQNIAFTQDFLRNQTRSQVTQGRGQLGRVRQSAAASGLKLSGTTLDVFRDEKRKISQGLENTNRQGQNQLSGIQNQVTNLRAQASQLRAAGQIEAELGLRLADISTHNFI